MTKSLSHCLALACLLAIPQRALPATITADGVTCTLFDAIRAANADAPAGGCAPGSGPDLVLLAANESIDLAEAIAGSSSGGAGLGGFAGLPDVTSVLTIQAAGGNVIERAPEGCGPTDDFRLLNVVEPGDLTLVGLTLRNGCVAPDGSGTAEGGAVHALFVNLTLENTLVVGNVVRGSDDFEPRGAGYGGGLYVAGGHLEITGGAFERNLSQGGHRHDGVGLAGPAVGGAIYLNAASASMVGTRFVDNVARAGNAPSGLGSGAGGAAIFTQEAAVSRLADTLFQGNVALAGSGALSGDEGAQNARGGAIAVYRGAHGLLERLTFRNNAADAGDATEEAGGHAFGGALFVQDATVETLRYSTFSDNTATGGEGPALAGSASGGGIAVVASRLVTVDSITLAGNQALGGTGGGAGTGGGLFVGPGATVAALLDSTFFGNVAQGTPGNGPAGGSGSGGGLATAAAAVVERASHLTVAANLAAGGAGFLSSGVAFGGGVYAGESSTLTIDNSVLADNARSGQDGGGVDCASIAGALVSAGFNHEENADGSCTFASPGDVTGSDPLLGPFGDHGCTADRRLPDGGCPGTVALLPSSLPVDRGSCAVSGLTVDERGFPRPIDLSEVPNAADGCDKGAFELQRGGFVEIPTLGGVSTLLLLLVLAALGLWRLRL